MNVAAVVPASASVAFTVMVSLKSASCSVTGASRPKEARRIVFFA
jgi:hypothetical protein